MAWLVPHVAAINTYRVRGEDGKTAYERARLRPFNGRLLRFAEQCSYRDRPKEVTSEEYRWHKGIFLGMCGTTGQYVLYDVDKKAVKHARTVKPLPEEHKWNVDIVESMRLTPFDQHIAKAPEVTFQERPEQPGDKEQGKKPQIKKLYIKSDDLKRFGFTPKVVRNATPKSDTDLGRQRKGILMPAVRGFWKSSQRHRKVCEGLQRLKKGSRGTLLRVLKYKLRHPKSMGGRSSKQLRHARWCARCRSQT